MNNIFSSVIPIRDEGLAQQRLRVFNRLKQT
jgi:hypothetical protein